MSKCGAIYPYLGELTERKDYMTNMRSITSWNQDKREWGGKWMLGDNCREHKGESDLKSQIWDQFIFNIQYSLNSP